MNEGKRVRLVNAITVRNMKEQAVRMKNQNVSETHMAGEVIEMVLRRLELWNDGENADLFEFRPVERCDD